MLPLEVLDIWGLWIRHRGKVIFISSGFVPFVSQSTSHDDSPPSFLVPLYYSDVLNNFEADSLAANGARSLLAITMFFTVRYVKNN